MPELFFRYLFFPGFLFSAVVGLLAVWLDRKVTARLQWRVGPPWHQCFMDIVKLFNKEVIVPEGAKITFILAPFLGLAGVTLLTTILGRSLFSLGAGFGQDMIVVMYLLLIPVLALIIGASASGNPLASIGVSREMKLVLSYELPFILAVITVIIKTKAINLNAVLDYQAVYSSCVFSLSGLLAFLVALMCVVAKLGLGPFDISEAEQEIMGGVLIEYSGFLLAVFKIGKAILIHALSLFLIILFLGRDLSPLFLILKYSGILVAVILIKNTNPRLRIDQALRFFWGKLALLGVLAVILSLLGL
ncbi:MAG: complex I subunit 1 family protein [Candidatus Omnitrophota bacterium]|nr:NADH-quinone oxidoreductase subunit H [Candidatus Omnitrophota bacterium]